MSRPKHTERKPGYVYITVPASDRRFAVTTHERGDAGASRVLQEGEDLILEFPDPQAHAELVEAAQAATEEASELAHYPLNHAYTEREWRERMDAIAVTLRTALAKVGYRE